MKTIAAILLTLVVLAVATPATAVNCNAMYWRPVMGNDSNDGLTPATAKLTIHAAYAASHGEVFYVEKHPDPSTGILFSWYVAPATTRCGGTGDPYRGQ